MDPVATGEDGAGGAGGCDGGDTGGAGGGGSDGGVWGLGGEGEGVGRVATGSFVSRLHHVQGRVDSLLEYLTVAQSPSLTRHQPTAASSRLQDSSA